MHWQYYYYLLKKKENGSNHQVPEAEAEIQFYLELQGIGHQVSYPPAPSNASVPCMSSKLKQDSNCLFSSCTAKIQLLSLFFCLSYPNQLTKSRLYPSFMPILHCNFVFYYYHSVMIDQVISPHGPNSLEYSQILKKELSRRPGIVVY